MTFLTRSSGSIRKMLFVLTGIFLLGAAPRALGACTADLNGDGFVDGADLGLLLGSWGVPGGIGDLNGDNNVDGVDLAVLLGAWGNCPIVLQILEPGTMHIPPASPIDSSEIPSRVDNPYGMMGINGIESSVYGFSGESVVHAVDLRVRSRGMDFVMSRKYRSRQQTLSSLGVSNQWDFSYNISIEQSGPDLVLHDGNTRDDLYLFDPGTNTWSADEFFRTITQGVGGEYVCTFPTRGLWRFNPFIGSPQDGKIDSITDRNGNTMQFVYDPMGRLNVVRDTLYSLANPREYVFTYDPNGFLRRVTDYSGREVLYEYYDGIMPGGSFGDLKAVHSPAVFGTSTGNDFPTGKTTVYTYSTGFADPLLNGNLLTITDPKGQTYVTFEYDPTLNPLDPQFDRMTRQMLGGPLEILDWVYVPQNPGDEHPDSVLKVIVNDRAGNVSESLYDIGNRCVEFREFTGRANADLPTGETTNRPAGQVRASDPVAFVTNYEYNIDSLCTRVILPRGNSTVRVYDSLNPDHRSRGNMLSETRFVGGIVSDQIQIVAQSAYDPVFNFDTNLITQHTDGKGNFTNYVYDTNGNAVQIVQRLPSIVDDFSYNSFGQMTFHIFPENGTPVRKIDSFTYYDFLDGPMEGYRKEKVVDSAGFALTTTYEYDPMGRITRSTDPRGNDTLTEFNQLDQVVRVDSRLLSVPAGPAIRYDTRSYYDANDNLVRVDVRNLDKDGIVALNDTLTSIYEYDILDYRTLTIQESGDFAVSTLPLQLDSTGLPDSEFISTVYTYDDNQNLQDRVFGEAAEGRDTGNFERFVYDERDLVFQEVRAPGEPEQSTMQYDYDQNRNVVRTAQGLEDIAGGGSAYETLRQYDGYDRLIFVTTAMGNTTELHYDANSNTISKLIEGEIDDILGGLLNVPLYDETYTFDALDRLIREETQHFDTATQAPIGDGLSTYDYQWTDASNILIWTDDNMHVITYAYDSAYRVSTTTDANANSVTLTYDANSNVVQRSATEKSDALAPDQIFDTTYVYDALDRLLAVTDSVGNTTSTRFDSRNNPAVAIDPDGNATVYFYDGANRRTRTVHTLTDTGTGAGLPTGTIDLPVVWDDSHRVVVRTDGEGNSTQYTFDSLDRVTQRTHADTTQYVFTYDPHDNVTQETDPSGTINTFTYDLQGRRTGIAVAPGPGVSAETTFVTYGYDGLDRLVAAVDDDSNTLFEFDSLSNRTRESRGGIIVDIAHDGVGNITRKTYPSGIEVLYSYNNIDLVTSMTVNDTVDFVPLVTSGYVGTRYESHTLGNGLTIGYIYDGVTGVPNVAGDSGFRRASAVSHATGGGPLLDFTYGYDARQNKTEHSIRFAGVTNVDTTVTYDSVERMVGASTVILATPSQVTVRALDAAGNRVSESGTSSPGSFFLDPTLLAPADSQMNQYTTTPRTSETHKERGELAIRLIATGPSSWKYVYNYDNKLVQQTDSFSGVKVTYRYDAIGRRIGTTVVDVAGVETTDFVLDGVQVIEERNGVGSVLRTLFYGAGVDEYLAFTPGTDILNMHYMHRDNQDSVHVVTDSLGLPVEAWRYSDFGEPRRSLYSQQPDQFGAAASDTEALPGFMPQKYAENFVMPENARVATMEWGGGYAFSTPALIPPDDFTIRFYEDAAGLPGVLLHEENVGQVGRTITGNIMTINSVAEYLYTSRIEFPPVLQSGLTYWVSIENNLIGTGNVWGWETSVPGDGVSALSVVGGAYFADTLNFSLHVFTDESAIGNPYLFQGRRHETETRLYDFRSRFMDPQTGRFITRDSAGMWNDPAAMGNGYTFAGNNPYTYGDPFGQAAFPKFGDVDGEAKDKDSDHSDWIAVGPITAPIHGPSGNGSKRGKADINDLMIVKPMDSTSAPWVDDVLRGKPRKKASKSGGRSKPTESVTLNYTSVQWPYKMMDDKGSKKKGNVETTWKVEEGAQGPPAPPSTSPPVLKDTEKCEGLDDNCGDSDGVVSPSNQSYDFSIDIPFYYDYGFRLYPEAKAHVTPYGADGMPFNPPAPPLPPLRLDWNPSRYDPHVTPYGADGKPYVWPTMPTFDPTRYTPHITPYGADGKPSPGRSGGLFGVGGGISIGGSGSTTIFTGLE